MNFKYIDIHSHLNLSQFDVDRDEVALKLKENDIATITVGVDYPTSQLAVELAEKHENLFACIGIHPTDTSDAIFDYEKMKALALNPKTAAIGECGFDYFRDATSEDKIRQKEIFESHIKFAIEVNKPLMIHARPSAGTMDAYEDVLDMLEQYQKDNPNLRANFHFFVGNRDVAKRVLALHCTMSFDGPITFARDYDDVIQMIPLESIMAETDAPFASPVPHRGKRCEPQMVIEVVKKIAEIKGISFTEASEAICTNAKRVFDI